MKKILPIFIAILIIAGAGAFYGGMKYAETKKSSGGNFPGFENFKQGDGQQRFGQMNGAGRMGNGQNFLSGEILSKDDKSITIKLPDGGSKIIFFSSSTEITKSAEGTADDLTVGENVLANGQSNTDGSITAKTIQLRPALPIPPTSAEKDQASQ